MSETNVFLSVLQFGSWMLEPNSEISILTQIMLNYSSTFEGQYNIHTHFHTTLAFGKCSITVLILLALQ